MSKAELMRALVSSMIVGFACAAAYAQTDAPPTPTVAPAAAEPGKDVVHQLNNAFAHVFETVAPSVVIIEVSKKAEERDNSPSLEDLFRNQQQMPDDETHRRAPRNPQAQQSEGSGFIVRQDGYIYTNHHVVEGADDVLVKLKDGRDFKAKVVGADEKTDVAVLKIEATNLPVVQLGDSEKLRVGEFAFAIGAPFRLDYTFTYGVVSGKGRSKLLATGGYQISDYIQTDASINPGNSGGPLCDIDGRVIGMNTLINGLNRGLGFAVPINLANEVGQQLIAGKPIVRPWLGIRIETLGDDVSVRGLFKGIDKGVVVRTIEADAPAAKSELRPFDVITQVDGVPVGSDNQLQHEILKKKVGQSVQLTVWRKGQTMKVAVATGELPNDITRASNDGTPPKPQQPQETNKFGIQVQELTKEVAERLHLNSGQGVVVTDVAEGSIAASQGIEREDVITEVDNKPVTNLQTFRDALQKADPRKGVLLYLDRKGGKTFAVLKADR